MQVGRRDREDLVARCRDADRVLELGRQGAVLCHRGPTIAQHLHLIAAGIDHRLDGEEHALAHDRAVLRPPVMQDRRRVMKDAADAVAAEIAHDGIAVAFGIALDRIADRADMGTRPHDGDAAHHRLVGDLDELSRLQRNALANKEHSARVAVPAVEDHRHIDVQNVAVHQTAVAGDAVADDMIDRSADRFREAAVIERRRDRLVPDNEFVAEPVELAGRDPRADMRNDEVERRRGQPPGLPHAVERVGAVDLDLLAARGAAPESQPRHQILLHDAISSLRRRRPGAARRGHNPIRTQGQSSPSRFRSLR